MGCPLRSRDASRSHFDPALEPQQRVHLRETRDALRRALHFFASRIRTRIGINNPAAGRSRAAPVSHPDTPVLGRLSSTRTAARPRSVLMEDNGSCFAKGHFQVLMVRDPFASSSFCDRRIALAVYIKTASALIFKMPEQRSVNSHSHQRIKFASAFLSFGRISNSVLFCQGGRVFRLSLSSAQISSDRGS